MIQLFQTPLKKYHQTAVIWGYYGIYIQLCSINSMYLVLSKNGDTQVMAIFESENYNDKPWDLGLAILTKHLYVWGDRFLSLFLVGGLEQFLLSHSVGNFIIPID